ncbi:hypothetical protein KZ483_26365 [Paenibacillus sp. sptzw28]|uniref:hypothetical protein n=1 Tax=Paenibacillus sp. sptzw28 TaxID=715179 RepID=UPI001C6EDF49|nr:hypothetical protein [Paenibacillus sp. sptzw28]QYR21183.1 hypothetical protein KZ483_26365 [Paenibacillus sp. sptzw28]
MTRLLQAVKSLPLTALLRVCLLAVMTLTSAALFITLSDSWSRVLAGSQSPGFQRSLKDIGTLIAKPAEFGIFGAAGYWVLRELIGRLKSKPAFLLPLLRSVMLFLKRNHTFIGWFILIVAVSHGCFFLFIDQHSTKDLITGLSAFTGLAIVSGLGIYYSRARKKKIQSAIHRKWHFAAAVMFIVLFLIHLYL